MISFSLSSYWIKTEDIENVPIDADNDCIISMNFTIFLKTLIGEDIQYTYNKQNDLRKVLSIQEENQHLQD